ncbi:hypothetical protein A2229_00470 [Candidatus Peregrinibacteria bacterium RIFOXYA2_FULL_33_7]|nr:MAG: hypothetical protein A2229_00470 [Candidatus Peregrinibacteria bacterium RIFOXYA2_FULL_33_7]
MAERKLESVKYYFNLSILMICPKCNKKVKVAGAYHAGFGDDEYLYCHNCSKTLLIFIYDKIYNYLINGDFSWKLSNTSKNLIEKNLQDCDCGGNFRFNLEPRCPNCHKSLQELIPNEIYY